MAVRASAARLPWRSAENTLVTQFVDLFIRESEKAGKHVCAVCSEFGYGRTSSGRRRELKWRVGH